MRFSAVILLLDGRRYELTATEAERLPRYLRLYEDATGSARDLAERIERAGPHGYMVYPADSELAFLLRALEDIPVQLSDEAAELTRDLRRRIG
jgi:hypothetical protein